ncbi:phospholipase B1, membrane-associated-like [Xylocopa sonorina]|uniref:phospholipase B1, membrane-associated-like n=1 Tax=Xylocopa sonorina TaxID=1818115 RepID=UPI00403B3839
MEKLRLCFLLQLCALTMSQRTELESPEILSVFRQYRNWIFEKINNDHSPLSQATRNIQEEVPANVPFPCNVTGGRSLNVPNSVHRLRPGDIDVIAAMGDSLTAGSGIFASNVLQVYGVDNRGVTAAIGGKGTWRKYLTLPNILKEFNPKLIGYALGDSLTRHPDSQLDVAEFGATSNDMPFMAKHLVNKMKRDPRIDIKRHWKLISIMIGSNDFCVNICVHSSPWSMLKDHRSDLVATLRILRDNLPRTLVAIHLPPHLKALVDTRKGRNSLHCYMTTTFECSCLFALQFRHRRPEYYEIMRRWQKLEEEIADYPEFHRDDFTVVSLPTLKNITVPLAKDGYADLSYLSADCFHVGQKANALYANGLWNNLLEPVGSKSEHWDALFQKFLCPTSERPFLMTRENSQNIK